VESASIAHGHGLAHEEHHGPPAAHHSSRVHPQVLGVLLFIVSEAMLFGSFFTAMFFIRVVANTPFPPAPFDFPVTVAAFNTAVLISSSGTMHFALHSIKHGNRAGLRLGLVATFFLGLTFLCTQVNEYFKAGFAIHDGAWASAFYGLTGLHGLHVFVGLTLLAIMATRAFRGHFGPETEDHMGVEMAGIYWHFVDVMWIIVFLTVYIL
jgi:cytochrome c oxidase subunit 3